MSAARAPRVRVFGQRLGDGVCDECGTRGQRYYRPVGVDDWLYLCTGCLGEDPSVASKKPSAMATVPTADDLELAAAARAIAAVQRAARAAATVAAELRDALVDAPALLVALQPHARHARRVSNELDQLSQRLGRVRS